MICNRMSSTKDFYSSTDLSLAFLLFLLGGKAAAS